MSENTKERPILFSAPMVRAILGGKKTVTRRIAKLTDSGRVKAVGSSHNWHTGDPEAYKACPYGQPGDRLWVRETWKVADYWNNFKPSDLSPVSANPIDYAATPDVRRVWAAGKWRPSIFMPRWASRITLEVTGLRLERLQEVRETDAVAEGVTFLSDEYGYCGYGEYAGMGPVEMSAIGSFRSLWESINGSSSWTENPWVWVVEFRRVVA